MDRARLVKEQRRLEKQLRKQGVDPLPVIEDEDGRNFSPGPRAAPDEFAHLPPPKITDNTVPSPVAPRRQEKAQLGRTPHPPGARRPPTRATLAPTPNRRRGHPFRQLRAP